MSVPAAWPSVVTAVTTLADTLGDVRVTRGRDTTNELGDFVMVGVAGVDDTGWDNPGSFDQEFHTFGGARAETGTVNVLALSRTGDAGDDAVSAAMTSVFALVGELTSAVRADPALGLAASFDYLTAQISTGEIHEELNNTEGALASISLTVTYSARI